MPHIDASFTVLDARGQEVRRDKRDQNQLVLEWDGEAFHRKFFQSEEGDTAAVRSEEGQ